MTQPHDSQPEAETPHHPQNPPGYTTLRPLPSPSPSTLPSPHSPIDLVQSSGSTCRPYLSSVSRRAPSALPALSELRSSGPRCRPQPFWPPAPATSVPLLNSSPVTRTRHMRSSLPGMFAIVRHWLRQEPQDEEGTEPRLLRRQAPAGFGLGAP